MSDASDFKAKFEALIGFQTNPFHPLVWVLGEPIIGKNVHIGGLSEVNAKGARITIGDNCDIASFVSINCADSHRKVLGLAAQVDRQDITIEHNVFIGSHSVVRGGAHIGHHSVVAAGTVVSGVIPPYSLVMGSPMQLKPGYYKDVVQKAELARDHTP